MQCNPGVGLKAFFDMVHVKPKKLVLFGAACSAVTDQIAKAAKHWNLVQVNHFVQEPKNSHTCIPYQHVYSICIKKSILTDIALLKMMLFPHSLKLRTV